MSERARRWSVLALSAAVIAVGVLLVGGVLLSGSDRVDLGGGDLPGGVDAWAVAIAALDMALMALFIYLGWRERSPWSAVFAVGQVAAVVGFLAWQGTLVPQGTPVVLDRLSLILVMVTCSVGPLIAVYSLAYMRSEDHQGRFLALVFLFLAAMDGAVLSNDLLWLFFFWEVTTLCSFLLIRHRGTEEAVSSAKLAMEVTLGGGLALAMAVVYAGVRMDVYGVQGLAEVAPPGGVALLVPALLVMAGMTKAAQFPFQKWLLGAMVAPTPVSALLHSSTMVNLGVYAVLRSAPLLRSSEPLALLVAVLGAASFTTAAVLAATQANAKRLLAYSTISNLGLVVMCAGLNTAAALVAGILVLLFHAVSKAMLFLSVGVVDKEEGTRDVDAMGSLSRRMPLVSNVILLGAVSMMLPPFGLFAGKLLSVEAAATTPALVLLLGVGSAATLLYYVKWVGSVISGGGEPQGTTRSLSTLYTGPLVVLSAMVIALSVLVPLVARDMVYTALPGFYGSPGASSARLLGTGAYVWLASLYLALAAGLLLSLRLARIEPEERSPVYTSGEPYTPRVGSSLMGGEGMALPLGSYAVAVTAGLLVSLVLVPFLLEVA